MNTIISISPKITGPIYKATYLYVVLITDAQGQNDCAQLQDCTKDRGPFVI